MFIEFCKDMLADVYLEFTELMKKIFAPAYDHLSLQKHFASSSIFGTAPVISVNLFQKINNGIRSPLTHFA